MTQMEPLPDRSEAPIPGADLPLPPGTTVAPLPWSARELVVVGLGGLASMLILTLILTAALATTESRLSLTLPRQVTGAMTLTG